MISVYFRLLADRPYVPLLDPLLGAPERAFGALGEPLVARAEDPGAADYLLLPHHYDSIKREKRFLDHYAALSGRYGKNIVVFADGDRDAVVALPNAIVFRTSQYGHQKAANEIMMPAYAEDLLGERPLGLRTKSAVPVVGFCGWADFKSVKSRIGHYLRKAWLDVGARSPAHRAHAKGLFFRRAAMAALRASPLVETRFVVRAHYSGEDARPPRLDPGQARREFVENMLESDLCLVVKGNGNYSRRFYEALSLGRVPLLIDTDCVLPLADVVPYPEFVLRIDHRDIAQAPTIVANFWSSLDDGAFAAMQRQARAMFERYLCTTSFLRYAVERFLPRQT